MATYQAPLRDMQFVLHELLGAEREFAALPGFEETTRDLIDPVLEEAAKLCENVMFPLNRVGDQEGCTFEDGEVRTPTGFRDAYRAYVEGGWGGLTCNPEFGGQGLPHTLSVFVEEMLQSSNMALALYPGLTHGACIALDKHGTDDLRRRYLPKLVDGTWSGVMCLTESHCGTDLGLLRTRAEPAGDGRYRVTGTKIFITGGEQDLSENIVHFVLARLSDAPPGVKGISMFLVPKFLAEEDGSRGERNAVHCGSIEHKMGIRGASTCVMNYDGAIGYLIGEPHRGMRAMFSMMNYERLMVGQQGLSLAEVAYQSAADYARDRLQGRSLKGRRGARPARRPDHRPPRRAPDAADHPRLQRGRACAARDGFPCKSIGPPIIRTLTVREAAGDAVGLFTPVIKAFFTDYGFESCNLCQQVFGGPRIHLGMGHGAARSRCPDLADLRGSERHPRARPRRPEDCDERRARHPDVHAKRYLTFVAERRGKPELEEFVEPLGAALARLEQATQWLKRGGAGGRGRDRRRVVRLSPAPRARRVRSDVGGERGDRPCEPGRRQHGVLPREARDRDGSSSRRLLPNTASLLATLQRGRGHGHGRWRPKRFEPLGQSKSSLTRIEPTR